MNERRVRYRRSPVALPALYIVGAVLLGLPGPRHLSATAAGMIAFTGFVQAGVLVVVQFAAGQYSRRRVRPCSLRSFSASPPGSGHGSCSGQLHARA